MVKGTGDFGVLHLALFLSLARNFNAVRTAIEIPTINRTAVPSSRSSKRDTTVQGSKHVFAHVVQGDFQNYDSSS